MKKYLLFMLGVLLALPGIARDFTYEYEGQTLTYTVIDEEAKTCEVTYSGTVSGNLVIPAVAKNGGVKYSVTSIGDRAFSFCYSLTSVRIPNSVTSIGYSAFLHCRSLISVSIPNSVTSISDEAFQSCYGLTSVSIPNSVTSIGDDAFYECYGLTSVEIPNSVTSIGHYAFAYCNGLTSITIPNSVTSIGDKAFNECSSLTSVTISNSVTLIDYCVFYGCSSLTTVDIPNSVTEIVEGAFADCISLTSVSLPNSVTVIDDEAFYGCTALSEIVVPPSVETIGAGAFAGNTELSSIIMGHRVKTIGEKAFDGCPAQNVYITAQTPPDAPDNTFSNYAGKLYVQGENTAELYRNSEYCWPQFERNLLIEPTHLDVEGDKITNGKPGDTFQFTAKLYPEDVTLPQIFWRSTNPDIATVDKNGLVTLHADQSEVMTIAADDDIQDGTCKIIAESLYANGPIVEVFVNNTDFPTGIDNVTNDSEAAGDIDFNAPIAVYNLQGAMVGHSLDNVAHGIYIVRQGNIVKKIAVK